MPRYELIAPDFAECMDRYCSKHGHTPFTLLLLLVTEYTVPEFVDWKIIEVGMDDDDSHKLLVDHFFYSPCTYTSTLSPYQRGREDE